MHRLILCGFLALVGLGCSSDVPRGKLTGTVKLDGKLVRIGTIYAVTEDGKFSSFGEIGNNGEYEIANAPVGKVKVWIIPPTAEKSPGMKGKKGAMKPPDSKDKQEPKSDPDYDERVKSAAAFPKDYTEYRSSGLTATVEAGGSRKDFDLQSKSKK